MTPQDLHTLVAEKRDHLGSRGSRKLREDGRIPAVIYGHGEANVYVTLPRRDVENFVRTGNKVLNCSFDSQTETVLLKDVQYDFLGDNILHLDLTRVNLQERVSVTVPIELRGDARGVLSGGIMMHELVAIEVECMAASIPESLRLNVTNLEVGDALHVSDIVFPTGVTTKREPTDIVCIIKTIKAVDVPTPAGEGPAEPEVIKKGKKEEEAGEAKK